MGLSHKIILAFVSVFCFGTALVLVVREFKKLFKSFIYITEGSEELV